MRRTIGLLTTGALLLHGCGWVGKTKPVAPDVVISDVEVAVVEGAEAQDAQDASPEWALAEEQMRSAELERRLDESTRQVEQLRRELEATRRQAAGKGKAESPELWGHTPAALPPGVEEVAEPESPQAIIASLREALAREGQRREALEKELARLKVETSSPVFGDSRIPEADFLAVKQELVELRRTLDQERRTREQIAEQLTALQREKARPVMATGGASPEMRARLRKLEEDKRKILESLDRSVATSQRRAAELERRLRVLRTGAPGRGDTAVSIQAENAALRASLEEERKRTELLAAKLKAASQLSDEDAASQE